MKPTRSRAFAAVAAMLGGVALQVVPPAFSRTERALDRFALPGPGVASPAVTRPSLDSVTCRRLEGTTPRASPHQVREAEHVGGIGEALEKAGATLGSVAIAVLPEEFAWWLHVKGPVNLLTLSLAVHETSHALENLLRLCGSGSSRYALGSRIYDIGVRPGELPRVSDLARRVPPNELASVSPMRLRKYFHEAAADNDFSTLIGELVAYVVGAQAELVLLERARGWPFTPDGLTAFDGNLGGMVDLVIMVKAYLAELDRQDPAALARLLAREDSLCLLHALHVAAAQGVARAAESRLSERVPFRFGLERREALEAAGLVGEAVPAGAGLWPARWRPAAAC